jgi:CO/xanthine dehydrogenase Mo-binding subunit
MADAAGVNGTIKEFRVVGKPNLPGVLSWAQASGDAKFGIDFVVPDMLHAKFLRSPYANARIKKLVTTKAKAIPGVVDVIAWEDKDLQALRSGSNSIRHSLANTRLIIMAIHNAIGKWIESPATPDRVLKALGKG